MDELDRARQELEALKPRNASEHIWVEEAKRHNEWKANALQLKGRTGCLVGLTAIVIGLPLTGGLMWAVIRFGASSMHMQSMWLWASAVGGVTLTIPLTLGIAYRIRRWFLYPYSLPFPNRPPWRMGSVNPVAVCAGVIHAITYFWLYLHIQLIYRTPEAIIAESTALDCALVLIAQFIGGYAAGQRARSRKALNAFCSGAVATSVYVGLSQFHFSDIDSTIVPVVIFMSAFTISGVYNSMIGRLTRGGLSVAKLHGLLLIATGLGTLIAVWRAYLTDLQLGLNVGLVGAFFFAILTRNGGAFILEGRRWIHTVANAGPRQSKSILILRSFEDDMMRMPLSFREKF